jgi:hypothetical protein
MCPNASTIAKHDRLRPSSNGLAYLEWWRRAWALERAKDVGGLVCRQRAFVNTEKNNTREGKGNRGSHVRSFVSIWALWAQGSCHSITLGPPENTTINL